MPVEAALLILQNFVRVDFMTIELNYFFYLAFHLFEVDQNQKRNAAGKGGHFKQPLSYRDSYRSRSPQAGGSGSAFNGLLVLQDRPASNKTD